MEVGAARAVGELGEGDVEETRDVVGEALVAGEAAVPQVEDEVADDVVAEAGPRAEDAVRGGIGVARGGSRRRRRSRSSDSRSAGGTSREGWGDAAAGTGARFPATATLAPFAGATNDPREGSAGSPGATRVTLRLSRRVVASHRASRRTCASTRSAYTPSTAAGRFATAFPLVSVSATLTTHATATSCASAPAAELFRLNASDRPEALIPRREPARADDDATGRTSRDTRGRELTADRARAETSGGAPSVGTWRGIDARYAPIQRGAAARYPPFADQDCGPGIRNRAGRDATGIVRRGKV